jgi:hypothetical protein
MRALSLQFAAVQRGINRKVHRVRKVFSLLLLCDLGVLCGEIGKCKHSGEGMVVVFARKTQANAMNGWPEK